MTNKQLVSLFVLSTFDAGEVLSPERVAAIRAAQEQLYRYLKFPPPPTHPTAHPASKPRRHGSRSTTR